MEVIDTKSLSVIVGCADSLITSSRVSTFPSCSCSCKRFMVAVTSNLRPTLAG